MAFELIILGCASATPTSEQYTTSQLLTMREQLFLIDCGEGVQQQLRRHRVKTGRINHIFISHLHGDHYFGLVGLISSFHLQRRKKELHIYGPKPLEEIIHVQLKASKTWLTYPLVFHVTNPDKAELVAETNKVEVYSIPLIHGIATTGFKFIEKHNPRSIDRDAVEKYGVPKHERAAVQRGMDWENEQGEVIPNAKLTVDPPRPLSYAFWSDTCYNPDKVEEISEVDVLYHEATFTQAERDLATQTKHSTAGDAAQIAHAAQVRCLILGHYSSRYPNRDVHLAESKQYFQNVIAGHDNMRIRADHQSIEVV
ncbi:ribonuclease Z [Phaeocystidibacter luteus]|uniref:Ribonuclease Z n=1 Tax=Phaeocystidibacter luteus TaxID=911197 RepID=A0A6N6RMJ3_9FLAO|nr:ribonuclease Z [Phaeocystidibacter luteus]KAB2814804.1 ribonuclease Z [Phaeocystidibacter luteus]